MGEVASEENQKSCSSRSSVDTVGELTQNPI